MNTKNIIWTLAALSLVTACEKGEPGKEVDHVRTVYGDQVVSILDANNKILSGLSEREKLFLEQPDLHKLYKMIDDSDQTADYFNKSCEYYEAQWIDHTLAGRLADVHARVLTLCDLIQTNKITSIQLEMILRNNLVISWIHESDAPAITAHIDWDMDNFFQNSQTPISATTSGNNLVLTQGSKTLTLQIKY